MSREITCIKARCIVVNNLELLLNDNFCNKLDELEGFLGANVNGTSVCLLFNSKESVDNAYNTLYWYQNDLLLVDNDYYIPEKCFSEKSQKKYAKKVAKELSKLM